jgi:hypothetical protein
MTRIEEAVVRDLAGAPAPPPVERVRRGAQRRRARFWATAGVAAIAVMATAAAIARPRHDSSFVTVRPRVSASVPSDVVVFDDNGGLSAVDFSKRTVTHYPLGGWRAGDQPYLSLRVGNNVVAGWGDVYATPLGGGKARLLGTGIVVPAVEPGAVWLTSYGQVRTSTERLVDMRGRVLLEGATPRDASGGVDTAITGAPGGLVLQTANGLAIWDARTGRVTRRLGSGPGVTALPMAGSLLAWCEYCDRSLELTDLTSDVTRSVAVSLGGGSLVMQRYFGFSPDAEELAVLVQPDAAAPSGATAKVVIVAVATGKVTDEINTHARYAAIAWSPDGERLYIAASGSGSGGRVLVHDRRTRTTAAIGPVPDASGSIATVMTPLDAASFPKPTVVASPTTCPGPIRATSPRTVCTYRF